MTWFSETRIEWAREMIAVYGFVNREHIQRKFGVSVPAASSDLKEVRRRYPDEVKYNTSSKRYEAQTGAKPAVVINKMENHHGNG